MKPLLSLWIQHGPLGLLPAPESSAVSCVPEGWTQMSAAKMEKIL